jgi:hypothetical protein
MRLLNLRFLPILLLLLLLLLLSLYVLTPVSPLPSSSVPSISVSFDPPSSLDYKHRLRECSSSSHCGPLLDTIPSCLTSCISPSCHASVYGSDELEPGETNAAKWKEFEKCGQQESKQNAKK